MKQIYLLLILTKATLGCVDEPVDVHLVEQTPVQNIFVEIDNFCKNYHFTGSSFISS